MSQTEQVKPLTPLPFANSDSSYEHRPIFVNDLHKSCRRRSYIQCCGCVTAVVLVIVVTFLIFSFTVYNVKEPQLSLNSVTLINSTQSSDLKNMTLIAVISVRNPNVFTFRFGSSTTVLSYNGTGIGEGVTLPGKAMGKRTTRMNVTVEIMTEKLMENPRLRSDVIGEKALNISSLTKVDGNVKVLNLFKRKVGVKMNCSGILYNMTSRSTHIEACFSDVDF